MTYCAKIPPSSSVVIAEQHRNSSALQMDNVHPVWTRTKFDPQITLQVAFGYDTVHMIWTAFGMDIQLDPRNKLAEEFLIILEI